MKKQKLEASLLISKGIWDGTHAVQSFPEVIIPPNSNQCEQIERADALLKRLEKILNTINATKEQ
jgi:hypothetical protein